MGNSVAGQIRIDLLANAAQFKAGMREGGREGFGAFKGEAEKFDRWFNSRKSVADRMTKEQDSWVRAMRDGGPLQKIGGFLNGDLSESQKAFSLQTRYGIRMRDYLPWGTSMRTELSREAAMTAAAIGASKQTVVNSLAKATKEISAEAATAGGLGGLVGTVGKFAMGHPLLVGAGLTAGFMAKQIHDRDILAGEMKAASRTLGQGSEDTSRLMASGFDQPTLSKFQKSMADQSPEVLAAFSKLNLDPNKLGAEPLLQSLLKVRDALEENIRNPADRASIAMHLFGRGGATMIATLDEMKEKLALVGNHEIIKPEDIERVEAWEHALKGAGNTLSELNLVAGRALGSQSGFVTNLMRDIEGIGVFLKDGMDGIEKLKERYKKEDHDANPVNAKIKQDARIAATKLANEGERYAAAMQKANEKVQSLKDRVEDLTVGSEKAARNRFFREATAAGINVPDRIALMKKYDAAIAENKQKEQADKESKQREQDAKQREQDAKQRERDMDSFRDRYRTPAERRQDELNTARELFGENSETYNRVKDSQREQSRNALGVKNPLGDYLKEMDAGRAAFERGDFESQDEYDTWIKDKRTSAIQGMIGNRPSASPIGAMEAGSAAAHSAIAQNMVADPKVKLGQDIKAVLDKIEKGLGKDQLAEAIRELTRIMKE